MVIPTYLFLPLKIFCYVNQKLKNVLKNLVFTWDTLIKNIL